MRERWGEGGCGCGAVRFQTVGEPQRVGLCHCMMCRKAHSSAFNPFVVFNADQVEIRGATSGWESSPGVRRHFCPTCGSRVVEVDGGEVELYAGSFDQVGRYTPQYEMWTVHREPWLQPLPVRQIEQTSSRSS